jgi:uncharacterized protein
MDGEAFIATISAGDRAALLDGLRVDPTLANVRGPSGESALQWAVYTGHSEFIDDLLAAGATVDFATACTIGRIEAITDHAPVNLLSADGFRPIALAVAFGHNDIVRLLLQKGADPNQRSTALGGVAPIHAAVFGRNLEGLKLLVEAGANVNEAQAGGFTPLMGAAQNGDADMVRYLVEMGADIGAANDEGMTAADYATSEEIRVGLMNGF